MNTAIYELIETAEFVVNADGEKKAVMLDFSVWEDLLNLLENIDDGGEIEKARASGEKPILWTGPKPSVLENSAEENLRIYQLAREYLLSFDEISEEMINMHLAEWRSRKPNNIRGLFRAMILHAQNRQSMPNSIGDIDHLSAFLFDFDPHLVLGKYNTWEQLFDTVANSSYRPPGRMLKENKLNHWVVYCKSILSCANFLTKFRDLREFDEYIEQFYVDDESRFKLPQLLSKEVFGFGFALACDFLKEVGYPEFVKVDVHIIEIAQGVGISAGNRDVEVFRDMIGFCRSIGKLPYEVDKLFWLIGSGKFYLHDIRIPTSKGEFIQSVRHKLPRFTNDRQV